MVRCFFRYLLYAKSLLFQWICKHILELPWYNRKWKDKWCILCCSSCYHMFRDHWPRVTIRITIGRLCDIDSTSYLVNMFWHPLWESSICSADVSVIIIAGELMHEVWSRPWHLIRFDFADTAHSETDDVSRACLLGSTFADNFAPMIGRKLNDCISKLAICEWHIQTLHILQCSESF